MTTQIKIKIGDQSVDGFSTSSKHPSRQSSSRIIYGNLHKTPSKYKQRKGEHTGGADDTPDMFTMDYPQFVEEEKTLDCNLNSFQAYH